MARFLVVGAGAIGQCYGALLVRAGHAVTFLARRDAPRLRSRGLDLTWTPTAQISASADGSWHLPPSAFQVCDAVPTGPFDWVLVTVKTTALDEVLPALAPLLRSGPRVVALCNGLGVEERLAAIAMPGQVFGQLCFVCINRDADGTVRHLGHGRLGVGHLGDDADERARLADLWRNAGVTTDEPSSLREARWRKLVWNVPFNGLSVRHDCTVDVLLRDHHPQVVGLMAEVVAAANADLGAVRIEADWIDEQVARTRIMGDYAPSTLLDARAGQPLETEVLLAEPLRRAQALGVAVPLLTALVRDIHKKA